MDERKDSTRAESRDLSRARSRDLSRAQSRDPMQLWVGSWVPEDAIDRETRTLSREETRGQEENTKSK